MIFALFGGCVIDNIGLRASFMIFSVILAIGQMIFLIASYMPGIGDHVYVLAMISQIIYGIGKKVLVICRSVAISNWFIGQEWGLAFGICLTITNFEVLLSIFVSTLFSDPNKIKIWNIIGLCYWICAIISSYAFTRFEKYANELAASQFNGKQDLVERFRWSSIRKLDIRFWIISLILLCLFIPNYNFLRIFGLILDKIFDFKNENDRALIMSINYAMPVIFSPIIGVFIDKMGHQITWLIISSILLTISHVWFCFLPDDSHYFIILPLVVFGLSHATYFVCIWTLVPLVVTPNALGTGFGIVSAWEFFGMSISPILLAVFVENGSLEHGRIGIFSVFIIFPIIGLFLSIILYIINFLHIKKQRPAIERYNSYDERLKSYCQKVAKNDRSDSDS